MSSRKRKHQPRSHHRTEAEREPSPENDTSLATLFIQAYEADIIRGPEAALAARSLEVREEGGQTKVGSGLIRWESLSSRRMGGENADSEWDDGGKDDGKDEAIWVDRYDARLLLDFQPKLAERSTVPPAPSSPSGWSDLPSDAEDTFFLSAAETEDLHNEKRCRLMEQNREERIRAIREQEGEEEPEIWGGSDEEPPEEVSTLMQRTATHMAESSNSAQLTSRILANHGSDTRFAFLRGRWSRAWALIQATINDSKAQERAKEENKVAGMLAGYGDSDEESEEQETDTSKIDEDSGNRELEKVQDAEASTAPGDGLDDQVRKAKRRARAKAWAEQRKITKGTDGERNR